MRNPRMHARRDGSSPGPSLRALRGPRAAGARVDGTLVASAALVASVLVSAWLAGSQAIAVYALAFWHYLLYALAYRFGAVPLATLKRDAVLMKGASLLGLASAYLTAPLEVASLAVVAAGFLLNALAASVLGADRTYYGHEVAGLPRLRVTRFPYSLISHPMLVGNMLAYGGTLLNAEFRAQWWPLACAHVALNLGLLAMERHVAPLRLGTLGAALPARRGSWIHGLALPALAALLAVGAAALGGTPPAPIASALAAAAAIYGLALHAAYTTPTPRPGAPHPLPSETTP